MIGFWLGGAFVFWVWGFTEIEPGNNVKGHVSLVAMSLMWPAILAVGALMSLEEWSRK